MRHVSLVDFCVCFCLGGLGGLIASMVGSIPLPLFLSVPLGMLYGMVFSLFLPRNLLYPGAGLIWGLAYTVIVWLIVPVGTAFVFEQNIGMDMLDVARSHFPELVAYILFFGVPLGLYKGYAGSRETRPARQTMMQFPLLRAIIIGGLAGLVGGWAFSHWFVETDSFVLIAGILASHTSSTGIFLHYVIAATVGVSFGVLFQREIHGPGSGLCWGLAYALLWWFLGPLTLLSVLLHQPINWSYLSASMFFGSFIGHAIYGIVLGCIYACINQLWVVFFFEADPVHRMVTGPGAITLRSLGWGALASIVGGLLFSLVMFSTGVLPQIALLVRGASPLQGFAVHLVISILIGMSYGLLFRQEASNLSEGVAWGLLYGLVWWFLGPLTLMPLLLGHPVTWTLQAAVILLPSLLGHLLYGAATGLVFFQLEHRHDQMLQLLDQRLTERLRPPIEIAVPALWFFVLALGVLLPIIL